MRATRVLSLAAGLSLLFAVGGASSVSAQDLFVSGPVTGFSNQGFVESYGAFGYGGFGPRYYGAGATSMGFGVGGYGAGGYGGGVYGVPMYDAYYGQGAGFYTPGTPYYGFPPMQPYVGAGRVGGLIPNVPRLDVGVPRLNPAVPALRGF